MRIDPIEGEETVGYRQTQAGAQALAAKHCGERIYGWFARGRAYGKEILEVEVKGVTYRLTYGW